MFIWVTLDPRIDTTDLLTLALREGVAFVPGRGAYADGRRGSSSMRLNFAGSHETAIREAVRRIGRAAREQLGLLGTLTGRPAAAPGRGRAQQAEEQGALADVVALRGTRGEAAARRRRDR
jgi:2-aminoadipate transaminase